MVVVEFNIRLLTDDPTGKPLWVKVPEDEAGQYGEVIGARLADLVERGGLEDFAPDLSLLVRRHTPAEAIEFNARLLSRDPEGPPEWIRVSPTAADRLTVLASANLLDRDVVVDASMAWEHFEWTREAGSRGQ